MLTIQRAKFLHQRVTFAELDEFDAMWRAWFEAAGQKSQVSGGFAQSRVEVRVSGFAAAAAADALAHLRSSLAARHLTDVQLLDGDTAAAVGEWVPVTATTPAALGSWAQGVACCPAFDLCTLMLRFSVEERDARGTVTRGQTLVLFGLIANNAVDLKAVWPAGGSGTHNSAEMERIYHNAVWPDEGHFMEAARQWSGQHRHGQIPVCPQWATPLFGPVAGEKLAHRLTFLIDPPRSQFTLRGLFTHLGWFAAAVAIACGFIPFAPFWTLMIMTAAFFYIGLYLKAAISRVTQYHHAMKSAFEKLYSGPLDYPEIDLTQLGVLQEPSVRKNSVDLVAAGCTHWRDIKIQPFHAGESYIRLYLSPGSETLVGLLLMTATKTTRHFPYMRNFLLTTRFADGYRAVSSSHPAGYRKAFDLPVISRSYGDIRDAADILSRHDTLVQQQRAKGRVVSPVEPALIIEQMRREHEEVRPLAAAYGYYSWSDAIHEAFAWKRKERN